MRYDCFLQSSQTRLDFQLRGDITVVIVLESNVFFRLRQRGVEAANFRNIRSESFNFEILAVLRY